MKSLIEGLINNANLFKLAKRLPTPVKSFIKSLMRVPRRRAFAMSYYKKQLNMIGVWSKKHTEDTNFYYKLTPSNRNHLAHLISNILDKTPVEIISYFDELDNDEKLRSHIERSIKSAMYGNDIVVNYGRRLGWYAIARAIKPKIIVETGVDHGVGSCVLTSALLRNAQEGCPGKYFGTDINPKAGQLLSGEYAATGEIIFGDSIKSLQKFEGQIDLFVNDSDHSAEYEYLEYLAVTRNMSPHSIILSDNAHVADSLLRYSVETGRKFMFFSEKPENHWYPGAGIGISFLN